jgi:hypothetical protein
MAAPARSVENLGRNLRALIQQLVVETRKANFNRESPATQTLLKNFASQAHTYQIAAKNAGKKLNANQARANLKGNAAAAANAAAVAAAATVENTAGSAVEAAKANATPSALRAGLTKAVAAIRNLTTRKTAVPVATLAPTAERVSLAHTTFNSGKKYFNTQPNSNRVTANKLQAGARKRILGGWNYGANNSRKATFWKEYNALDKNLENMARTRNFTRYIPLGRNTNKNITKYPKYTQFFTNVKNLPGLNTRRNALLIGPLGIRPNHIATFNKSVDDLLKQYNKYKGYEPVGMSAGQLWERTAGHKARLQSNANRTVFKGFANKGPAEYRLAKRNVASNRKAYGTDPEFKKFWNAYNKSEAALKLGAAKAAAVAAANKASVANISVGNATTAAANAARAAAEARTHFNKTNRTTVLRSVRDAANTASKRAQASLAAAKKREEEAAARTAANAKAAAKAAANAQKAEAARVAAEAKAAANKTAKITKLKKNISNARNAANKARQAVNASKAEAAAVKARNLRAQLNNLGADQAAKNVANQQVQEARGHADAAKKAAAQKTFNAELAQFIKVKSYAKPESLATILARMNGLAPIAGIATNNARLLNARNTQRKVAIKYFIQEVWPKTARGGKPGTNNVNRIAGSYGLAPLTNADRAIMNGLIPKTPNKNSIIGWRRLQSSADANYNERVAELKNALGFPTPASAPPPPPPGPIPGSRGASLLEPNKRGRPSTWTINQKFQNAYAKNNQNPANLFVKSNNGTYRKTNNNAGTFINANVYNWVPSAQNFVKR